MDEANEGISADGPVRGLLRVSLPVVFAQLHVTPLLPDFLRAHAGIELDLILNDMMLNLVEERIDVAIRIGNLDSSSLIGRKLAPHRRLVCASPAYLEQHGEPDTPADLAGHDCLTFSYTRGDRIWRFRKGSSEAAIRVKGSIRVNNSLVLRDAALAGIGIILMPSWLVGRDVETGRLRTLLPDWEASPSGPGSAIHAVYLPNRRNSRKVRTFTDFLAERFGSPPYWDRSG